VVFRNVRIDGTVIRNSEQLVRSGFDLSVPVSVEP